MTDNTQDVVETVSTAANTGEKPKLELTASRQFLPWLVEQKVSLSFSTYQTGKIFFVGVKEDGKMSIFERTFDRCMGLHHHENSVYMGMLYQIWRMENMFGKGERHDGYDAMFVPQSSYVTGDVDAHDISVDKDGNVVFVNTLFSCVATTSPSHSFKVLWKPKFISKLAAEDRCHLNGLAMKDGKPKYVTAVSETDVNEGWRDHRDDGGIVIDIDTDEIVCKGLSMPHSPRYYKDKLWLHNSGTGEFGYVDLKKKVFEPVCFCPGYLRGLSFVGDFAIVGLSKPRENKTFSGLKLDDNLKEKGVSARCALMVIDLRNFDIVHNLKIDGIVEELYDVVTLPNIFTPMAIGFKTDEIRRVISIDEGEDKKKSPPAKKSS